MSDHGFASLALIPAMLTGAFCVVFAWVLSWLSTVVGLPAILGMSFISGFLGSLFAWSVWRRPREAALRASTAATSFKSK